MIDTPKIHIGKKFPLTIICGPCVIESEEATLYAAKTLVKIFAPFPFSFIFKASFDKANRSSIDSFRGPGLEKGLKILQRVQQEYNIPLTCDVHTPEQAQIAGEIIDIIQIPAFLCRQTDLLIAASKTPAVVNVKKGQFMAPWDMEHVTKKLLAHNKKEILLTDRGTCFGYNNLVSDFRSIPIMQNLGFPVCFDATHSVQQPAALGSSSGGQVEFVPLLAKAAVACGCDALFIEAHPSPKDAKSDAKTCLDFAHLPKLLKEIHTIHSSLSG